MALIAAFNPSGVRPLGFAITFIRESDLLRLSAIAKVSSCEGPTAIATSSGPLYLDSKIANIADSKCAASFATVNMTETGGRESAWADSLSEF